LALHDLGCFRAARDTLAQLGLAHLDRLGLGARRRLLHDARQQSVPERAEKTATTIRCLLLRLRQQPAPLHLLISSPDLGRQNAPVISLLHRGGAFLVHYLLPSPAASSTSASLLPANAGSRPPAPLPSSSPDASRSTSLTASCRIFISRCS